MRILGIETSCDETALAVLEMRDGAPPRILAEEISSQSKIHKEYGGVVPELAAREHLKNLPLLADKVLKDAHLAVGDLSVIGVTCGPGLKGCLLMGVGFAKGLALAANCPLIGVNHIEGHLLAPFLEVEKVHFPFLALVVSGGHTEIAVVEGLGRYRLVARTIDDAAGEAFDKSASLLGLEYPGGPALAALADSVTSSLFELPKVMREAQGFSFSGLKTAIRLLINKNAAGQASSSVRAELAHAVQTAIVDALIYKLCKAVEETGIKTVVVTGGVSANRELRRRVGELKLDSVLFPNPKHCMDNGAMIALVAGLRFARGEQSSLALNVYPRWPVEELH